MASNPARMAGSLLTQADQSARDLWTDAGFLDEDLLLDLGRRPRQLDGDHALTRRDLKVLEDALVPGL